MKKNKQKAKSTARTTRAQSKGQPKYWPKIKKAQDQLKEPIFIWMCCFDTWSWEDGIRCRSKSKKTTSYYNADRCGQMHSNKTGHSIRVIHLSKQEAKRYNKK